MDVMTAGVHPAGFAAGVRELGLAPIESVGGTTIGKLFPKLVKGTRYGGTIRGAIKAEWAAKAAMFTKGMEEAAKNIRGKETELDIAAGKPGYHKVWYERIGKLHAAIKAPVKRAEFARSLAQRMESAERAGEDIHDLGVSLRLANEAAMDANRAIFQQKTVVSNFFSMLQKHPSKGVRAGGRVARFLFPVVKIPVNIAKEIVTYHAGLPAGAVRVAAAYMKGIEKLPAAEREAVMRQLVKGSVGAAGLVFGYVASQQIDDFFKKMPSWFDHTPLAIVMLP